ncbi:MAG TPA: L,D-transpeptidase [Longimicrobiales bacterium]|nr:L,D-transpeptidase [Longimicrobiales bacterium]
MQRAFLTEKGWMRQYGFSALLTGLALSLAGCGAGEWRVGEADSLPDSPRRVERPTIADASDHASKEVLERALRQPERRILVSKQRRHLWLMEGERVLFDAPVAIGRGTIFTYEGQTWDFSTPAGLRTVEGKETDPLWVPPDWHYYEKAVERGLEPVQLTANSRVPLADGTRIEVRGNDVGRVNQYGNFWAFTPGTEIIFDGKIFMPPYGTRQRQIPETLGTHRLILGDGYLIHGTPEEDSIGSAASHGCVRLRNDDVAELYAMVDAGTAVYIF